MKDSRLCNIFTFKGYLPQELSSALTIAESFAIENNHKLINIHHIIAGIMGYIDKVLNTNSNGDAFRNTNACLVQCYLPTLDFITKSKILDSQKSNNVPKLANDITTLAMEYIDLLSRKLIISSLQNLYLLIIYLNINKKFSCKYYVPSGDFSLYNTSDFCEFLDIIKVETQKKSKKSDIPTAYRSPIKVDNTLDLTYSIAKGDIPTIIGREHEIQRVIDILCKKNKNNPVLIGHPGVGKTAIVSALATKIVNNEINSKLKNAHILLFDVVGCVAGTSYRGDFEKKIKSTIDCITSLIDKGEKIIVCIDEIHSISQAGNSEGALTLGNILKPFLLNPNIKVIGTSTFKDYQQIEHDKALERRFDTIKVKESTFEETLEILNGLKSSIEQFHGVFINESTLETVITLSQRYIPERFLPDKAIDLLDETCSIKSNSYIRDNFHNFDSSIIVSPEDAFLAVSIKKEIPIQKVKDVYDLMHLEDSINSKVIGQTHVSSILAKTVRRAQSGLNDENKPLGSFMFIGPTGVGKTETAKALAEFVFGGKNNIIRFDMSEYMEEHSISKLIGAPPGYIGYNDSGLLTEQVRRNPYSLVLFDEFEKAHPKVCNLLLQILDEGCLTDSRGDHINFKNTIIILTSNVGANELSKKSVGFGAQASSDAKNILPEVKKKFPPEFLNRLDEIIQFNQLSEENIFEIAKLHVSSLIKKLNSLNIRIDISDEVISKIAKLGYNRDYGGRELNRAITREIKNPLSDYILQNDDVESISVELVNDKISISPKIAVPI